MYELYMSPFRYERAGRRAQNSGAMKPLSAEAVFIRTNIAAPRCAAYPGGKIMLKTRNVTLLLLLSSVAVLPACSMGDHSGSQATYTLPQPPGVSPATIRQVQTRLQQEGDYSDAIDGVWGPSTEAGVRAYQQHHNLAQTGQLDTPTMASINAAATPQPAAMAPPASPTPGSPMPSSPMPSSPMPSSPAPSSPAPSSPAPASAPPASSAPNATQPYSKTK
jgi:hypothetical protein